MIKKDEVIARLNELIELVKESEEVSFCTFRIANDFEEIPILNDKEVPKGFLPRKQPTGWRDIVVTIKLLNKI